MADTIRHDGFEFHLPDATRQDFILRSMRRRGTFYEPDLLNYLKSVTPRERLVIDCGANIGNHTVFFSGVMGCRTVAVEPVPENATFLATFLRENGLSGRVDILPVAVGARDGNVSLALETPANPGKYRVVDTATGITVPCLTIDAIMADVSGELGLIKIDVEGFEAEVIKGASATLRDHDAVLTAELASVAEFEEFKSLVAPFGYVETAIFNATPTVVFEKAPEKYAAHVIRAIQRYEEKHQQTAIKRGHMATYPARTPIIQRAVLSVIDQLDHLYLVLNEFDEVPAELANIDKLTPIIPDDDLKDAGKFLPEAGENDHVFLLDDDISYPANHVTRTMRYSSHLGLDGRVFGYHGSRFDPERGFHARERLKNPMNVRQREFVRVDQLGTGTVYLLGRYMPPFSFMAGSQKFVDVRFARWAYEQGLEAWTIPRNARRFPSLLKEDGVDDTDTIAMNFTSKWPQPVLDEVAVYAGTALRAGRSQDA